MSYFKMFLNCRGSTSFTDSAIPNPRTKRAAQPRTPTTVMNILFFDKNRFLAVTFDRKLILFQMKGIFSKRILLPLAGAFALKRSAAFSSKFLFTLIMAATLVNKNPMTMANITLRGKMLINNLFSKIVFVE